MFRKKWKNEKSGSSDAKFCKIGLNLKRFSAVCSIFFWYISIKKRKNEKPKKVDDLGLNFVRCDSIWRFFKHIVQFFLDICPGKNEKNEKSGSSGGRFCQIWMNFKRFQQIGQFFPDIYIYRKDSQDSTEKRAKSGCRKFFFVWSEFRCRMSLSEIRQKNVSKSDFRFFLFLFMSEEFVWYFTIGKLGVGGKWIMLIFCLI